MSLAEDIEARIAAAAPEPPVAEAWRRLALAPLPDVARSVRDKAFLANDLCFHAGGQHLYSAVLNQGWVLVTIRRPALRAGFDAAAFTARFPQAREGAKGEWKLRLAAPEDADALLALMG